MTNFLTPNRRRFLAGQLGAIAAVGLPVGASARSRLSWETVSAAELSTMIGEKFWAVSDSLAQYGLNLIEVEEVSLGKDVPIGLKRKSGLIAAFDSPHMSQIVSAGHQTVLINHRTLGRSRVFIGAVPKRSGGHIAELVLS